MAKNCKHENIIITYKKHFIIPQGWNKLIEEDDIDMFDYLTDEVEDSIFCEDCGKYIDE